jgi:hypothetical protein
MEEEDDDGGGERSGGESVGSDDEAPVRRPPGITRVPKGGNDDEEGVSPPKKKSKEKEEVVVEEDIDLDTADGLKRALRLSMKQNRDLQKRVDALEEEAKKAKKETVRMRDIESALQRTFGLTLLKPRKDHPLTETLKSKTGYQHKRSIDEVQFRDVDGKARYPGIDEAAYPGEKQRSVSTKKPVSEAAKKRAARDALAAEQIVYTKLGAPASSEETLGVNYYMVAEQVQLNKRHLDMLNRNVLPLLEQSRQVLSALTQHLVPSRGGLNPPTLLTQRVQGSPLFHWEVAVVPHLGLKPEVVHGAATKSDMKAINAKGKRKEEMQEEDKRAIAREADFKRIEDDIFSATSARNAMANDVARALANAGGDNAGDIEAMNVIQKSLVELQDRIGMVEKNHVLMQFDPLFVPEY